MRCRNCKLELSGMSRVLKEGSYVDLCFRCGFENPVIPKLFVSGGPTGDLELKKLKDFSAGEEFFIVPKLAEVFEVLANLRGNLFVVGDEARVLDLKVLGEKWAVKVTDLVKPELKTEALRLVKADLLEMIGSGLAAVAPAVAAVGIFDLSVAYESFKKVLEQILRSRPSSLVPGYASKRKEAYLGRVPSSPFLMSDQFVRDDEFLAIDFKEVFDFVKKVTPAVVSYAMNVGDDEPLKGLGRLVRVLRDFQAINRGSCDRFPVDYDRPWEGEDLTGVGGRRSQRSFWS